MSINDEESEVRRLSIEVRIEVAKKKGDLDEVAILERLLAKHVMDQDRIKTGVSDIWKWPFEDHYVDKLTQ